ncbi:peptidylprolyl isomerase [Candidatus Woesearchaeota archaeon]|nr:MAG: peptidylprolyl isomerase [Candidatus Woesearchaeota archaeon]
MTQKVKKGDFIELDYTGETREPRVVFDSTSAEVAKKEGFFSKKMRYGPLVICVGYNQILKGLDDSLEGLEIGKEATIKLPAERAFGKKSAANMKLVPRSVFMKNNIRPEVGLQVQVGGMVGTVKTVSSGRIIVDFNHPLAGKDVIYKVHIHKRIDDDATKVKHFVAMSLNLDPQKVEVTLKDGKPTIDIPGKFPQPLLDHIGKRLVEAVPGLKEGTLTAKEESKEH